jgi:mono/diheme cytochrome c family protein
MNPTVRMMTAAVAIGWIAAVTAGSTKLSAGSEDPAHGKGAPLRLSETGLYADGRPGAIDPRNRPFSPQYPLWSDGAKKTRWVFLPEGAAIDTRDDSDWQMPIGTKFWKEFTFNGRKVETRFLWRASAERWVFATYVWNEEGTDALLAPDAGVRGVIELAPGRRHDVPGTTDCRACHGDTRPGPLGFNALQLSTDRDPNAIHGEPLAPGMTTLATLGRDGLLSPARPEYAARPPRIGTSDPQTRAVLGYFAANCGTCHNRGGDIAYQGPSLKHSDVGDGDAIAAALLAQATAWQVPGQPEGGSFMLNRERPDASAMLVRMKSRRPSSQMPPLGTVLRDEEAIAAVTQWISRSGR